MKDVKKRGRKPIQETKPELIEALGTANDSTLAGRFGVSAATVGYLRRKYKVPPLRELCADT